MNNMSLKCEICGSVYKDNVVDSLMGTLIEAQDRQAAAQGLTGEQGIRLDILDAAARQRENANPRHTAAQEVDPAEAAEAHQRMQAFLEELLQLYVRFLHLHRVSSCMTLFAAHARCQIVLRNGSSLSSSSCIRSSNMRSSA